MWLQQMKVAGPVAIARAVDNTTVQHPLEVEKIPP